MGGRRETRIRLTSILCKMDATQRAGDILWLSQTIVYRVTRKGARFPLQLTRYRVDESEKVSGKQ
jgi:hypothetical protein